MGGPLLLLLGNDKQAKSGRGTDESVDQKKRNLQFVLLLQFKILKQDLLIWKFYNVDDIIIFANRFFASSSLYFMALLLLCLLRCIAAISCNFQFVVLSICYVHIRPRNALESIIRPKPSEWKFKSSSILLHLVLGLCVQLLDAPPNKESTKKAIEKDLNTLRVRSIREDDERMGRHWRSKERILQFYGNELLQILTWALLVPLCTDNFMFRICTPLPDKEIAGSGRLPPVRFGHSAHIAPYPSIPSNLTGSVGPQ